MRTGAESGPRLGQRVCLSVDLDPLSAYREIHGLPTGSPAPRFPMIEMGWRRFLDLARDLEVPMTFFVVGQTLEDPQVRDLARAAAQAGSELGNHTWSHPYDFLDLPQEDMRWEIQMAQAALERLSGPQCVGFRAPGYGASSALFDLLVDLGYVYDSSLLPSPAYQAAKMGIMALMKLSGRTSRSRVHDPRLSVGPTGPYRPDAEKPWKRGSLPLVEIPISVVPALRIPVIGTTLSLLPARVSRGLQRLLQTQSFVSLECHAIDLVDVDDDPTLADLAAHQPDLRVSWREKRRRLAGLISALSKTHEFQTLAQAARELK